MKSAGKTALNGFQQLLNEARHRFDGVSAAWVIADDATEASAVQLLEHKRLLARLLGSLTGLMLSLGITYYGVRWLVNAMDPTRREKLEAQERAQKLMKTIGINKTKLTEYELCVASNLVDPLSMDTDWEDIGGLSETILEIQETIILPFRHHELFAGSELVQPPKGVLLYGPPGCGKTLIARATAKAAGARFINLQVSTLVDKWYGESQKRAEAVFSLAHKLQPTIIFIDEIDSFLRSRASNDHEATSMMKTQFMSFWDGLTSDNKTRIMIIGATNRPNDVDAAILRRMSTRFHIGLPSTRQRRQILDIILRSEMLHPSVNLDDLASNTDGMSGSDLHELCRTAAICRVRELLSNTGSSSSDAQSANIPSDAQARNLRPIKAADFERALSKMKLGNRNMSQLSAYTLD